MSSLSFPVVPIALASEYAAMAFSKALLLENVHPYESLKRALARTDVDEPTRRTLEQLATCVRICHVSLEVRPNIDIVVDMVTSSEPREVRYILDQFATKAWCPDKNACGRFFPTLLTYLMRPESAPCCVKQSCDADHVREMVAQALLNYLRNQGRLSVDLQKQLLVYGNLPLKDFKEVRSGKYVGDEQNATPLLEVPERA